MNSAIYRGWVRHRRFRPKEHQFKYNITFLWLDLNEIDDLPNLSPWFSTTNFAALRFKSQDYLNSEQPITSQSVWEKVVALGGESLGGRVCLLGQVRCFGFYFSPVNFFYCYDQQDTLQYVVAEVSNTPWNERHCYLVPVKGDHDTPKDFHVSPFMNLDMQYRWRLPAPGKNLLLHIENHQEQKLFDATLVMKKHCLNKQELKRALWQIPVMSWHIFTGIHWQALRLWLKRVPYIPYSKKENSHAGTN